MEGPLKSQVFKDLYIILSAASSKCKVIDEKFPAVFFESDPDSIYQSYVEFLRIKTNGDGNLKDSEELTLTTIRARFDNGEYSASDDGFYKLYHDVRLVSTMLIQFYSPGTRSYQMVDRFYKFATELLLRECYKYGITFLNSEPKVQCKEDTEFYNLVSKDFIKISSSYSLPIVESYHISTKYGDLFSSTISNSQLDKRPPDLPNSNFEIAKIIPQTGTQFNNKLGFVAANTSNIPDPTLPPTEMMTKFLHPNWYALPTTLWLKYGGYESFAPTITENGSVVDSSRIGDIWLEKSGYLELWNLKNGSKKSENEEPAKSVKENSDESEKETDTVEEPLLNGVVTDHSMADDTEPLEERRNLLTTPKAVNINLGNLYMWHPSNRIDDDEIEAFSENTQHELISKLLVKLQNMKRRRVLACKIAKPTAEESQLYFKIQRMLREVVLAKQVKTLPKIQVKEFPVLQANYAGNIPVVRTYPNRKKKYKK